MFKTEWNSSPAVRLRTILECCGKNWRNRNFAYWTRDRVCRNYLGDSGGFDQLNRALCEDWMSAGYEHTLCSFLLASPSTLCDRSPSPDNVASAHHVFSLEIRAPRVQLQLRRGLSLFADSPLREVGVFGLKLFCHGPRPLLGLLIGSHYNRILRSPGLPGIFA